MIDPQDTAKPKPKRKETATETRHDSVDQLEDVGFALPGMEFAQFDAPYCDTLPEMGGYRREEHPSYSSFASYPFQTEADPEASEPKQANAEAPKKGKKVKAETLQSLRAEIAEKQKRLDEFLRAIQDLQSKEKALLEEQATRKNVLIGAVIQNQIKAGKLDQNWLMQMLNRELTRKGDRELFDLEPLPPAASKKQGFEVG